MSEAAVNNIKREERALEIVRQRQRQRRGKGKRGRKRSTYRVESPPPSRNSFNFLSVFNSEVMLMNIKVLSLFRLSNSFISAITYNRGRALFLLSEAATPTSIITY